MITIKFRAWHIKKKKMAQVYLLDLGPEEAILDNRIIKKKSLSEPIFSNWIDWKELKLMQSSGLRDKNEKIIYEGDIVKIYGGKICQVTFPEGQGFVINFYDKKKREGFRQKLYDHVYISGPSISISSNGKVSGRDWYTKRKPVIIGNIYENPELLK